MDISPPDGADPWAAASFADPAKRAELSRVDRAQVRAQLERLAPGKFPGVPGADSSQNHPNPANLTWRRYVDRELEGMAVYAGFSRDHEVVGLFVMSLNGETPITARRLAKVSIDGMRRQWRNASAVLNERLAANVDAPGAPQVPLSQGR